VGRTGQREVETSALKPRLSDLRAAPNLLSLLRLALTPVALALLVCGLRSWSVAVLIAMALTDGLDGYVARRTGRVTGLGRVLDPLADKVAVDSVLLVLAVRGEFPYWALAAVLARDAAIAAAACLLARRTGGVPGANAFGKAAFVALAALAIVYAADIRALEAPALALAVALVVASAASYLRMALVMFRSLGHGAA